MRAGKSLPLTLLLISSIFLMACPQRTRVAEIVSDPGRFHNKEVTIAGRVSHSYGALGQGIYQVDDGTGQLWVLAERHGVPSRDALVIVTGHVIPGLTYGGRNYATVLRETRRKHTSNN